MPEANVLSAETKSKLAGCPFCGGEAILLKDHAKLGLYVACTKCSACTITSRQSEAIQAWNRRTSVAAEGGS